MAGAIEGIPDTQALFPPDGRVAIATGAASGIGRMAASVLAQAGAHAVCADLDEAGAAGVDGEIAAAGGSAEALRLDVADAAAVAPAVDGVAARHGRLDVLVNSAGIARRRPARELAVEDWELVLRVNLTGTFLMSRAAAGHMAAAGGGAIVNLSSIMGHVGNNLYPNAAYHASKGGVVNLTRTLACEWGPDGVRVNDIAPTFTRTSLSAPLFADDAMMAAALARMPLGRAGEVADLAGAILYLASPASALVTGISLPVDGGWLAH